MPQFEIISRAQAAEVISREPPEARVWTESVRPDDPATLVWRELEALWDESQLGLVGALNNHQPEEVVLQWCKMREALWDATILAYNRRFKNNASISRSLDRESQSSTATSAATTG